MRNFGGHVDASDMYPGLAEHAEKSFNIIRLGWNNCTKMENLNGLIQLYYSTICIAFCGDTWLMLQLVSTTSPQKKNIEE